MVAALRGPRSRAESEARALLSFAFGIALLFHAGFLIAAWAAPERPKEREETRERVIETLRVTEVRREEPAQREVPEWRDPPPHWASHDSTATAPAPADVRDVTAAEPRPSGAADVAEAPPGLPVAPADENLAPPGGPTAEVVERSAPDEPASTGVSPSPSPPKGVAPAPKPRPGKRGARGAGSAKPRLNSSAKLAALLDSGNGFGTLSVLSSTAVPGSMFDELEGGTGLVGRGTGAGPGAGVGQLAIGGASAGLGSSVSSVASPGGNMGGDPLAQYIKLVTRALRKELVYPRSASRRRLEGTVRLELTIEADGTVVKRRVVGSSGHDVLDEAALAAAERVTKVPKPPDALDWTRRAIRIPLVYRVQ